MKEFEKYLQENGKYYDMFNEMGNPTTVGKGMVSQMLKSGYTFEPPIQVVYYKLTGYGFYTAPSAKYWRDEAERRGYTGIATTKQFAPMLQKAFDGIVVTPEEYTEFIKTL